MQSKGFTLIELIITVVLMSILLGALWLVYDSGYRPFYGQGTRIGIKGEVGRGFWRLADDLRHATSLTAAQGTSLTLTADTDDNGSDETLQYSWAGAAGDSLQRIGNETHSLIRDVSTLSFTYYDAGNNLLSSPVTVASVRMVSVNLTVTNGEESFTLRSQTRLRNLS